MTSLYQTAGGASCVLSDETPEPVYRYCLGRTWGGTGPLIGFFGINPSKATHEVEDLTALKWKGFAMGMGAAGYLAGNAFAFRATDVETLRYFRDPVGPENDAELKEIIRRADILVPCWGRQGKLSISRRPRLNVMADMLFASGKPVKCFGTTRSGDPAHPARLAYATPIVDWKRP